MNSRRIANAGRDAATKMLSRQKGASLVVSLVMLVVVLLLGISAAQLSILGEKASRSDRDRQIALQAAEAGLLDAELDIQGSPQGGTLRSDIFAPGSRLGFPDSGCQAGINNSYLGLCAHAGGGAAPAWQTVDFTDTSASAASVPYGKFTGHTFQTGKGPLPAKPPRYIIEQLIYTRAGQAADAATYFYRITAIGFGVRESTQVVLQTFYRKEEM